MADTKLKVEIQTVATGGGAAKVAQDLTAVKTATQGAAKVTAEGAKATSQFDQALNALGSRESAAKDVIEGTSAALKGNTDALFSVAKAAKNLIEVFSLANPVAKFASILALIGTAAFALKEKLLPAQEALTGTGEEAAEAAKKIGEIDQAKIDFSRQDAELSKLSSAFEATRKQADLLFSAQERLRDAKLGLAIAKIDQTETAQLSQKGLTEGQKAVIQAQAEAARTIARATAEQDKADAELKKSVEERTALQKHRIEVEKKADEAIAAQSSAASSASALRSRAEALGIKSDQQRELEELVRVQERLRIAEQTRDQLKSLPDIASASTAGSPFSGGVSNGPLEIVSREIVDLRRELTEREVRAVANKSVIDAGKETFEGARAAAERKRSEASENAARDPSELNKQQLEAANEAAEIAKRLPAVQETLNGAIKNAAEIAKNTFQTVGELNQRIAILDADIQTNQTKLQTSKIEGANDIRKADTKVKDASSLNVIKGADSFRGEDAPQLVKAVQESLGQVTDKVPQPIDAAPILDATAQLSSALVALQNSNAAAIAAEVAQRQALAQTVQAQSQAIRVLESQLKNSRR